MKSVFDAQIVHIPLKMAIVCKLLAGAVSEDG